MTLSQVGSFSSQSSLAELSASEFDAIAGYAHQTFGLHLPPSKREMVFARLIKRLRRTGIASFSAYLDFIKSDANSAERSEFLSALTTNVTQFFRENHHFEDLRTTVLPPLIDKARKGQRLRLWSAGCSAGQEPYSIAMCLCELCPEAASLDIKILATDIDPRILETARTGRYPIEERQAIPEPMHKFAVVGADGKSFDIAEPLRRLITFGELNLISEWPMRGPFDVIFCRNVAIYFDAETQRTLWAKFAELLPLGGHLMIGHSERLAGPASASMRSAGVTVYVKSYPTQSKSEPVQ